jgi:hypothetical protein
MNRGTERSEIQISGSNLAELASDVLAKGASFRFKVRGGSMAPLVRDGDIVMLSRCQDAKLSSGAIAAFIHPAGDRLVVHRIVGTRGGSFLVKGDNVEGCDGLIPGSRILGCVTRIERNGRNARLGLGAERKVLALFSRLRLLPLLLIPVRKLYRLWIPRTPAT